VNNAYNILANRQAQDKANSDVSQVGEVSPTLLSSGTGGGASALDDNSINGSKATDVAGSAYVSSPSSVYQTCPDKLTYANNKYTIQFSNATDKAPITFNTMEEYGNWQENERRNGNKCPTLFLQNQVDAQGNPLFLPARPTKVDGRVVYLDADRENPPYNKGNYPAYDPIGLYNGVKTVIDQLHDATAKQPISDNPMDANWGGTRYTQMMVDSGKYDKDFVSKPTYSMPLRNNL
jgi:hypothetical protein